MLVEDEHYQSGASSTAASSLPSRREAIDRFPDSGRRGARKRPCRPSPAANQQKALLGEVAARPAEGCYLLHEPTQGVDVGRQA